MLGPCLVVFLWNSVVFPTPDYVNEGQKEKAISFLFSQPKLSLRSLDIAVFFFLSWEVHCVSEDKNQTSAKQRFPKDPQIQDLLSTVGTLSFQKALPSGCIFLQLVQNQSHVAPNRENSRLEEGSRDTFCWTAGLLDSCMSVCTMWGRFVLSYYFYDGGDSPFVSLTCIVYLLPPVSSEKTVELLPAMTRFSSLFKNRRYSRCLKICRKTFDIGKWKCQTSSLAKGCSRKGE